VGFGWLDPLVALGLGGAWSCVFLWRLRRGGLVPARDVPVRGERARG
jgi:hypothetical protein